MLAGHARDARYPFLDLAFVDYVSGLPLEAKCDLTCPPGTGDKRLIRLAAASCGLVETSARVKRAMQFGTKSAKLNEAASSKGRRVGEGFIQECL
jgi:asparagine synthetase B (glutamine-hydrolysing)